jgi:soluble cytochrome b562
MKHKTRTKWPLVAFAATVGFIATGAMAGDEQTNATIDDSRALLGKWIETQKIIARERNDWQQGREILVGRIDLLRKELSGLQEKIDLAEKSLKETQDKRSELHKEEAEFQAATDLLTAAVTRLEAEVRKLRPSLPEPTQKRLDPLYQRIPEEGANARVSAAERFQNVIGILNAANADNTDLKVEYEVRNLADGKPSEVRTMYVGLAQAYYVSSGGEAGIGTPAADGWKWQPSKAIANDVLTALDIIQGKHSPSFISLPVSIQ